MELGVTSHSVSFSRTEFPLPKCMPLIPSCVYLGVYAHVGALLPCIVLSFLISHLLLVEGF